MLMIDSNGVLLRRQQSPHLKFRLVGKGSHVWVKLKRDSVRMLNRMKNSTLNDYYLRGKTFPSRTVSVKLNIFSAVRLFKHIRQGFDDELMKVSKSIDDMYSAIDLLNDNDCDSALLIIKSLADAFSRSASLHKRIAYGKLSSASSEITAALQADSAFKYYMHVNPAISIIFAAARRMNARKSDVQGKLSYELMREMRLRYLRDKYVLKTLAKLNESFTRDSGYAIANAYSADYDDCQVLHSLIELCSMENASFICKLADFGKDMARRNNKRYAVNLLRKAYKLAKCGDFESALFFLNSTLDFIHINKPFYFADQLSLTSDGYTISAQSMLTSLHDYLLRSRLHLARSVLNKLIAHYRSYLKQN